MTMRTKLGSQPSRVVHSMNEVQPFPPEVLDSAGRRCELHAIIHRRPKDFPADVVVRFWVLPPTGYAPTPMDTVFLLESMSDARRVVKRLLPRHVCVPRGVSDDIPVVETWIPAPVYHLPGNVEVG